MLVWNRIDMKGGQMKFIFIPDNKISYMINVEHIVSVMVDNDAYEVIKIVTTDKDEFNNLHIPVADFYKATTLQEE